MPPRVRVRAPRVLLPPSPGNRQARREAIGVKHRERDPVTKEYVNVGWPNYVRGILTDDEIAAVERYDAAHFKWERRGPRLAEVTRDDVVQKDLVS